jgi:hypothetical protein
MATMKKAQSGITRRGMAGMKKLPSLNPKMVPGEMTGKMYKKSEIDEIGRKQAAELDKSGVFGKAAMAKKKAPKAKSGKEMIKRADGSYSQRGLWDNIRAAKGSGKKPTAAMLKQEKKIKAKTKK